MSPKPEGGYAWVIVACAFFITALVASLAYSLGVLYVSLLVEFGESRAITSWVVSVFFACLLCIGPLESALTTRYGNRVVQVTGSVLACAGLALSYFVTSIYQLIITIGVIGGIGHGLAWAPTNKLVAEYFVKRRSLAFGFATGGGGIGTFILPPFIEWLEIQYGWRGALLILSGVTLNMAVCGLLMKPLTSSSELQITVDVDNGSTSISDVSDNSNDESITEEEIITENLEVGKSITNNSALLDSYITFNNRDISFYNDSCKETYIIDNSFRQGSLSSIRECENCVNFDHKEDRDSEHCTQDCRVNLHQHFIPEIPTYVLPDDNLIKCEAKHMKEKEDTLCVSTHSLKVVDSIISEPADETQHGCLLDKGGDRGSLIGQVTEESIEKDNQLNSYEYKERDYTGLTSIIKCPEFLFLFLSSMFVFLSYIMPATYMVDRAVENGIAKTTATIMVSISGFANLIGRIFLGFVGDFRCVDVVVLYVIVLVLCGLSTSLSALCGGDFILHGVYAAIFGFTIGGLASIPPVVTVEVMGIEAMGQAYGILLFIMGISCALGPPLAGWVYEISGGFQAAFIIHGLLIVFGALFLLPIIFIRLRKRKGL